MMLVNTFSVSFRILYGDFLGHARKTKFQVLEFNGLERALLEKRYLGASQ